MIKNRIDIRPNRDARRLIEKIAAEDTRSFGQMALIESRGVCPVDTGTLKRSLEFKEEAPKLITLRSRTGYGGYVHFGTSKMVARPYFAWGVDIAIPKFESMIRSRNTYRK